MRKLVIIDEDREFAQSLRQELERDLCHSVTCIMTHEEDVMRWISAGGLSAVQCVLINVLLPKSAIDNETSSVTGLRLVHEIRKVHRFNGLILVLTSSCNMADGERALHAGCDSYLHKPANDIELVAAELQLAMRGDLMMVSRAMRHVFIREQLSAKEARMMDMLSSGCSWSQIARELHYSTSKAAANIGYRVFDKLLGSNNEREQPTTKRERALERWRGRTGTTGATHDSLSKS